VQQFVFFAYIGFDAVSTAAQEARNPQKDMPIGILGSLVICTFLYIAVSGLLTATVHYSRLNIGAPVSLAIRELASNGQLCRKRRRTGWVKHGHAGDVAGQSRVFYSMANDGLLWKWQVISTRVFALRGSPPRLPDWAPPSSARLSPLAAWGRW